MTILNLPFAHASAMRSTASLFVARRWRPEDGPSEGSSRASTQVKGKNKGKTIGERRESRKMDWNQSRQPQRRHAKKIGENAEKKEDIICVEYTRGKKSTYSSSTLEDTEIARANGKRGSNYETHGHSHLQLEANRRGFRVVDDVTTSHHHIREVAADYLLPQGYPDSVAPQYARYMGWRGIQYFFGGAMSVFTTRSLLGALGVANRHTGEAAAAINWVLKDGAGRFGRFLFARWGRSLDCELKQFRLAGDLLMEMGAALELGTALAPRAFLPLACTANLAKNLAAVAASSTRAPIYRTFAKQNNMADITAKGESVANLADIAGTAFGIALAKANLPIVPTFVVLSGGYLLASRREVDSVELPYFNRARLSYATRAFFERSVVPQPTEANIKEPLLPWKDPTSGRIVMGSSVKNACRRVDDLHAALENFKDRPYVLVSHPDGAKIHVLLKNGVDQESVLHAALDAHVALWLMDGSRRYDSKDGVGSSKSPAWGDPRNPAGRLLRKGLTVEGGADAIVRWVARNGAALRKEFLKQSVAGGWKLRDSMLNPSETRLTIFE